MIRVHFFYSTALYCRLMYTLYIVAAHLSTVHAMLQSCLVQNIKLHRRGEVLGGQGSMNIFRIRINIREQDLVFGQTIKVNTPEAL